jgi:V/A-type H+-transporting ATPase subunit C
VYMRYPTFQDEDPRYIYAVGRVRALETRLLSRPRIDRLLDTATAEDLLKSLSDTDYGPHLAHIRGPDEYEKLLSAELSRAMGDFTNLCMDPPLISIFRAPYDFHNAKVLAKWAITETDFSSVLSDRGSVQPDELKRLVDEDRLDRLPLWMKGAVEEALTAYYPRKDPRRIDMAVDRCWYRYLLEQASLVPNQFLLCLFRMKIDLTNVQTLLRIRWLEEDKALLRDGLIPGGYLGVNSYIELLEEPVERLAQAFYPTPYSVVVEPGIHYLLERNSFVRLEKLCDDLLMGFIARTKLATMSPNPVIAYILAKQNEINILRMVFVGKLNGIPSDTIRERLPMVVI